MTRSADTRRSPVRQSGVVALLLPLLASSVAVAGGDPTLGRAAALDPERGDCAICHRLPGGDVRDQGTIGPPLIGLGERYDAAGLRARIANPRAFNSETAMPAYGVVTGRHRLPAELAGRSILSAAEIDDVVAWLLSGAE